MYKLKELEYLEKICDKVGNISVGGGNLLTELREIMSTKYNGLIKSDTKKEILNGMM